MSKRAKQKAFRKLRAQGMDFKTAAKLSVLLGKDGYPYTSELERAGFQAKQVQNCSCCGPIGSYILSLDEKKDVAYFLEYGSYDGNRYTREYFHKYRPSC